MVPLSCVRMMSPHSHSPGNGGRRVTFTPTELKTRQDYGTPSEQKKRRRRGRSYEKRENVAGYLFLLPWLLGIIVFTAGPVIGSLYLSFTNYNLLGSPQWIGLQNYVKMFQDPQWWDAVRVTLTYVIFSVPLKIAFALLIALVLKQGLRGLGLFRAIYYIPSLLGGSVAL